VALPILKKNLFFIFSFFILAIWQNKSFEIFPAYRILYHFPTKLTSEGPMLLYLLTFLLLMAIVPLYETMAQFNENK
jgi:hypothetical protein